MILPVLVLFLISSVLAQNPCIPRNFGYDSVVCVCNETYWDTIPKIETLPKGQVLITTSNRAGLRFAQEIGNVESTPNPNADDVITIHRAIKLQKMIGFGGAFTDATGINIKSLPEGAQDNLIRSYYSTEGIEYSTGRVPIAGTDFSTHSYSYDDGEEDPQLLNFALAPEDHEYKIPYILQAQNITNNKIKLFGSAWTAPTWMKTNNATSGLLGFIKPQYYETWAQYHLKFIDEYNKQGVSFWGLTTGNEPGNAFSPNDSLPVVGWLINTMNRYITQNLGPTIRNSAYSDLKIMALDDQIYLVPFVPAVLIGEAANYVDGIAIHWYGNVLLDEVAPEAIPVILETLHLLFRNKFILYTEACNGFADNKVELGSWSRGEAYSQDILKDISNWASGWTDWNMALDTNGGPNYINNNVDSPIIVNATSGEFYKNPMFYHLGHWSKFIPTDSARILTSNKGSSVQALAFKRPDKGVAVVILNTNNQTAAVTITDRLSGSINLNISERSITSLVYY